MAFINKYINIMLYVMEYVILLTMQGGASMADKKEGTFVVHVNKCENDTWQGQVTWADRDEKINFRSAMELMSIIDAALNAEEN
jgi:hypothetical protein